MSTKFLKAVTPVGEGSTADMESILRALGRGSPADTWPLVFSKVDGVLYYLDKTNDVVVSLVPNYSGYLQIIGAPDDAASIEFDADDRDDSADVWILQASTNGAFYFLNGFSETERLRIDGNGHLSSQGFLHVEGAGGTIGYSTGAGGTVIQGTSKATGVELNKPVGQITTHTAQLNAGVEVSFAVTNSMVAATSVIVLNIASGASASAYTVGVTTVTDGAFTITISNLTAGNLSEALVINFAVINGASA